MSRSDSKTKTKTKATPAEARLKRDQRRQAFKFSLAIAAPLAAVMAATFFGLKTTTSERTIAVQTEAPRQTAPPPQPDASSEAVATPSEPSNSVVLPAERETIERPPSSDGQISEIEQNPGFGLEDIATALSRINLDDNGQIQADQQARTVLEAAFLRPEQAMDETRFSELKTLIEGGLQGDAGQQAAAMAERFYRYSNAYREVAGTFGHHGELHNAESDFEQLSRLRRTYLGEELSDSLYGEEEALMHYTLQSMRIQTDETLSPEQKQTRQEALRKQVPTSLLGAPDQASTP